MSIDGECSRKHNRLSRSLVPDFGRKMAPWLTYTTPATKTQKPPPPPRPRFWPKDGPLVNLYDPCHENTVISTISTTASWSRRPTNNGTSLLIMSWMTSDGVELLAKLTKYLREKVNMTCWFISIDTPAH